MLYRRPLLARAEDEDELSELIFDVVVEEFAEILGWTTRSSTPATESSAEVQRGEIAS